MYVVAYERQVKQEIFIRPCVVYGSCCNRSLFSIPSKGEMAEEQEYLRCSTIGSTPPPGSARRMRKAFNQQNK